jgi:hypothetical protein
MDARTFVQLEYLCLSTLPQALSWAIETPSSVKVQLSAGTVRRVPLLAELRGGEPLKIEF